MHRVVFAGGRLYGAGNAFGTATRLAHDKRVRASPAGKCRMLGIFCHIFGVCEKASSDMVNACAHHTAPGCVPSA